MCKDSLNTQVSVRAPICKEEFDCPECHTKTEAHETEQNVEIVMECIECKVVFRRGATLFDEYDEYCPSCENDYIMATNTDACPGSLMMEFENKKEYDNTMFDDDREKYGELALIDDEVDTQQYGDTSQDEDQKATSCQIDTTQT